MKFLHIVRGSENGLLNEVVKNQCEGSQVTLVWTHGPIPPKQPATARVLVLETSWLQAPVPLEIQKITYHDLLDLIYEHDKVICW